MSFVNFVTIGHSDRTPEEFLKILNDAGVRILVDVRKLRGSNRVPFTNEDDLRTLMHEHGIRYEALESLAGRRPKSPEVPEEINGWWRNRSFHHYADYALSDDFRAGLERLIGLADEIPTEPETGATVAIMCAEAVWWRCHRRIITDHLIARGQQVTHLMGVGNTQEATLTEGAVVADSDVVADGAVTYPD